MKRSLWEDLALDLSSLFSKRQATSTHDARLQMGRDRRLGLEHLESRDLLAVTASLAGGTLSILGDANRNEIAVRLEGAEIVVSDIGAEVGRFAAGAVTDLDIATGEGSNDVVIDSALTINAVIVGGGGNDVLRAGGGPTQLFGGAGDDRLYGGPQNDLIFGGAGNDRIFGGGGNDVINGEGGKDQIYADEGNNQVIGGDGADSLVGGSGSDDMQGDDGRDSLFGAAGNDILSGGADNDVLFAGLGNDLLNGGSGNNLLIAGGGNDIDTATGLPLSAGAQAEADALAAMLTASPIQTINQNEVDTLLDRASAASSSEDAIIVVVDRNGRILGARVEDGVSANITGNLDNLVFAIDGAVAKARTAAFFSNNTAPLTSRTVQFISQTTITEREVNSNPSITDPNSTLRGPGFVAPIGIKGHFPPVPFTPQVDLFGIEHTNRDTYWAPGPDRILGTADDLNLPTTTRFNIDPAFVPAGVDFFAPVSYGYGLVDPNMVTPYQPRGIATLPGGVPIYKNGVLVGGIGVFFPGETGYASEENSELSADYDPTMPDRSMEAEYIAFVAAGGSTGAGAGFQTSLANAPNLDPAVFDLPFGRIDLVGITLDIYGPGGNQGVETLLDFAKKTLQPGTVNGTNQVLNLAMDTLLDGTPADEGWLVNPHDGIGISADEVVQIISQGVQEALQVRAAIRLPLDSRTSMIFSVSDASGEVLGLFRMPDATVFSIDVAVAKGRNVEYYADPAVLQPVDQIPGVTPGTAFTNRTIRYVSLPRLPEGIDGQPPGPFSILIDGGVDPTTGLNAGDPLPASAYQSVMGFDAFNPGTNFRDPTNLRNQNGIVFFPGSSPIYKDTNGDGVPELVGGFGVSGDGVDQDDVVTFTGIQGFETPSALRADMEFVSGVRLPYQKFNRNPRD